MKIDNLDKKITIPRKIKNIDKRLPIPPFRILMSAPSQSGKTTLLVNMLIQKNMYKNVFKPENTFIICPNYEFDDKLRKIKTKPQNIFQEWDDALLNEIIDQQTGIKNRYGHSKMDHILIILDDCLNSTALSHNSLIHKTIHRIRHMNISLIISTQKYSGVPRTIRLNQSAIMFWRPNNYSELDFLVEENFDKSVRKDMIKALKEIFADGRYNFFYINYQKHDLTKKFMINFDQYFLETI